MRVLVIGGPGDIALVGLAQKLNPEEIHYLSLGPQAPGVGRYGVSKVYVTKAADEYSLLEPLTGLARNYSIVITPVAKFYRTLVPMVAQRLGLPVMVDVVDVELRNGEAYVILNGLGTRAQLLTKLLGGAFLMAPPSRFQPSEKPLNPSIEEVQAGPGVLRIVSTEEKAKGKLKIEDADLIVSVGRGFRKKEDLQLAFELAQVLGAEVGCSRPIAADLKWLSEDHWVGLSGHKVRPRMYMAIGISGQPQHLAGMMESKVVVAVNNDTNAPIFKYCDYGVVEDLYKFIPALTKRLRELLRR
jgi:electron transfer flavoprotein alpha subunit